MYLHNGKPIDIFSTLTLGDFQYPAGFFRDGAERQQAGIVYLDDPVPPPVAIGQRAVLAGFVENDGVWQASWRVEVLLDSEQATAVQAFAEAKAAAIDKAFTDVDRVTRAAIGDRVEEYRQAEEEARAYRLAEYTGEVSLDISSYAEHNSTGAKQTNRWAADGIIARADAFRQAQTTMRAGRFEYQAKMRDARTAADLDKVLAAWNAFIAGVRRALGL
jgi:hypothetical protein